jgi:hypothetical protein
MYCSSPNSVPIFPPPPPTTGPHLTPRCSCLDVGGVSRIHTPRTSHGSDPSESKVFGHRPRTKYKSTTIACSMDFNSRPFVPWSLSSRSFAIKLQYPGGRESRHTPDARYATLTTQVRELTATYPGGGLSHLFRPFKPTQEPPVEKTPWILPLISRLSALEHFRSTVGPWALLAEPQGGSLRRNAKDTHLPGRASSRLSPNKWIT